jgi:hypothetical protein
METVEALERIDANRLFAEAEQLLASGDVEQFEQFVHSLENQRQQYLEIEKQASAALRQLEQQFT